MEKQTSKVGETALERTVRHLAKLDELVANPEVEGMEMISLRITPQGRFIIQDGNNEPLIDLPNISELDKFLKGPLALQVQAIHKGNVRGSSCS